MSKTKKQDILVPRKGDPRNYVGYEGSHDAVSHPSHYTTGTIEVIDFLWDQKLDFCLGNAVKYICRSKHKGKELEDLKKAVWYLSFKIARLEEQ